MFLLLQLEKLETYVADCAEMNDCVRLPSDDDKWLNFNNYRKEQVSFVVYIDLEYILEKTETEETSSYTDQYHRIFSMYYAHCSYDNSLSAYLIAIKIASSGLPEN